MNKVQKRVLKTLPMATVLALGTVAAQAATISAETRGRDAVRASYYMQSVEIGPGADWSNISFAFDKDKGRGFSAYAAGDLFILSEQYLGTPKGVNKSTDGFVAKSTGVTANGFWKFKNSLTLQANTTYYFVMGNRQPAERVRIFGWNDPSAPGYSTSNGAKRNYSAGNNDLDYTLRGEAIAAVPTPASALMLISALVGFGAVRNRRRRAA